MQRLLAATAAAALTLTLTPPATAATPEPVPPLSEVVGDGNDSLWDRV